MSRISVLLDRWEAMFWARGADWKEGCLRATL